MRTFGSSIVKHILLLLILLNQIWQSKLVRLLRVITFNMFCCYEFNLYLLLPVFSQDSASKYALVLLGFGVRDDWQHHITSHPGKICVLTTVFYLTAYRSLCIGLHFHWLWSLTVFFSFSTFWPWEQLSSRYVILMYYVT